MGRSMGGGGSRGGGASRGGGRSSGSHSMGGSRSGTSRAFGSGHSGGNSLRGSGRSYSGQSSSGNPMMGGFNNSSHRPGGPGFGGPGYGGPGHMPPPPPPHHHHYYGRRRYYDDSHAPSYQDSYSKEPRDKFTGTVNLNGFYSDPDGLLYNDEIPVLEKGLEHFYKTTGVCAYVYLVNELDEGVDGNKYASDLYDELFNDEGHILLVYDYTNAYMYDAEGYAIQTTIDSEALDMIYDYVEAEWANDSENLGAIFGNGCAKAADRMMYKEKTFVQKYQTIIIIIIVAVALIIVVNVLFKWWKKRTAQKNKEQEDLERTLNTPLQTFGTTPMDDLKAKYDNQDEK